MPGKQEWIIAAGLGAVLVTVMITLLMRQPAQPVIISVQTETPPVSEIGTEQSAAVRTVPRTEAAAASSVSTSRTVQSKDEVLQLTTPDYNLNTADEAALQEVSGVGAVLAAEIIAYRDAAGGFVRRSQLLEVSGIGETLAERIMERFYIPDEQPEPEQEPPEQADPEPECPAETETAPAEMQEQKPERIGLNSADRDALMRLPDMTEALADEILALRERLGGYQDVHELLLIPDIRGKYAAYFEHTLKEYLYIEE